MSDLNMRVSQMEGKVAVSVLHLSGDVDANSARDLDVKISEVLDNGASHLLLDLTEVDYMSSAGFRSMHKAYTALEGSAVNTASLKLLKPTEEVSRLLKTMGFEAHMPAYDDLNTAVSSF